ncbi:MAG: hypothetical protein AAGC97_14770 [Planctomycetota bacterium]
MSNANSLSNEALSNLPDRVLLDFTAARFLGYVIVASIGRIAVPTLRPSGLRLGQQTVRQVLVVDSAPLSRGLIVE